VKKLLIIPIAALIVWGGVKLYNHLRPPTVSEMIREVHESLPEPPADLPVAGDLPIIITPTPPDAHVTWPQQAPAAKAVSKKPVAQKSKAQRPVPIVVEELEPEPPVVRCLFWIIGEAGCRPEPF
jgi:hypothetical protein